MFIGPNDLAASFGHIGNWGHPEVQSALEDAVKRLKKIGKPAGILTPNEEEAKRFIQWGYTFVAVGADLGLLARHADALAKTVQDRVIETVRAASREQDMSTWRPVGPVRLPAPPRRAAAGALRRAMAGARGARAMSAAKPDDSHTNLGWDDAFGGLTTHPLPDGSRLGLRLADLTLAVLGIDAAHAAARRPRRRGGAGLARRGAGGRGLDAGKLDAPSPYAIPRSRASRSARAIRWMSLRSQFEALAPGTPTPMVCSVISASSSPRASSRDRAVRCWPHHFDLDFAVPFSKDHGMGFGFSPGDDYCDEPYFYVTIWPEPKIPDLPLLPPQGHWHSYEFLAALAPAHKIVVARRPGRLLSRRSSMSRSRRAIGALR